jgi:hypothetical protein
MSIHEARKTNMACLCFDDSASGLQNLLMLQVEHFV